MLQRAGGFFREFLAQFRQDDLELGENGETGLQLQQVVLEIHDAELQHGDERVVEADAVGVLQLLEGNAFKKSRNILSNGIKGFIGGVYRVVPLLKKALNDGLQAGKL